MSVKSGWAEEWKRLWWERLSDDVSWKAFNLGSFHSCLIVLSGEVGGRHVGGAWGGGFHWNLSFFLCTDEQRWRQVWGGFWGVVGVFHVNCDSVILLALFISISPEVRIFCESGWTFLSIFFFFPFNCVGQFWGALDMNKILVCVFTWRVGHNLLGSFLNTLWFLEMLWNGDCERTVAVITAVCHSLWIHPTQTGFFLYTWLVSFPLKRWDWKKATCFCWYLWACLFNFTWFCCINHWILV